jgi:hypothetical protein
VLAHASPEAFYVGRVGAGQERREAVVDEDLRRPRRLAELGDGLAPAHRAGVRLDADQRDAALHTAVVRLRVRQGESVDPADHSLKQVIAK